MTTLEIVGRSDWDAKPPKRVDYINKVVPYVVIHHSYSPAACSTSAKCKAAMRSMQDFHQNDRKWNDIGYRWVRLRVFRTNRKFPEIDFLFFFSFAIGGDGAVYEGRGFNVVGAHAPNYNDKSIGICLIGDWQGLCYHSNAKRHVI